MTDIDRHHVAPEVWEGAEDGGTYSDGLRLGALVAGAIAVSLGLLALAAGVFGR